MNNQLEQLLVAIDSSLEFEASFDKAVSSAINRSVYKDTSSTSFYGDNVDNTFSYTRESDTVSRQV